MQERKLNIFAIVKDFISLSRNTPPALIHEVLEENVDKILNTNFKGTVFGMKYQAHRNIKTYL
jgi:hypothetical protein